MTVPRDGVLALVASAMPIATFANPSTTMITGEPMVGIRTNGMTRLPRIAPVVFAASSQPDADPARERSSRSNSDAVGKAMPKTIVTGRTTRIAEPNSAANDWKGRPGSSSCGWEITRTSPAMASPATASCVHASRRIGSLIRDRKVLKSIAPIAIPIRKRARMTVNTYVRPPVPDASRRVQVT